MLRIFLTVHLLLLSMAASAIEQAVSLSTQGKDDFIVRLEAKNQALLKSLDKLPTVIWGQENLENGRYTEQIRAIGYAHAKVTVLTEIFDRVRDTYSMTANVQFDEQAILNTLDKVSKGQRAQTTLKQIRNLMSQTNLTKYLNSPSTVPVFEEAKLFSNPYFYASTHEEFVRFHKGLVDDFIELQRQQILNVTDQYQITLVKITKDHFIYTVTGPSHLQRLSFTSPELASIYSDYQEEVERKTGVLCLYTPLQNMFFEFPNVATNADNKTHFTLTFNSDFISSTHKEFLYTQKMSPIEVAYCENSYRRALDWQDVGTSFMKAARH